MVVQAAVWWRSDGGFNVEWQRGNSDGGGVVVMTVVTDRRSAGIWPDSDTAPDFERGEARVEKSFSLVLELLELGFHPLWQSSNLVKIPSQFRYQRWSGGGFDCDDDEVVDRDGGGVGCAAIAAAYEGGHKGEVGRLIRGSNGGCGVLMGRRQWGGATAEESGGEGNDGVGG
ncbi:hypothetical protein Tco_1121509 [Tanacetum coccineum]|uniref:Uncharacterized protein n=1 Tax=Tanacetum coccineum TaxID=301880 RepID=A0ABQ5IXW9_9ASTR